MKEMTFSQSRKTKPIQSQFKPNQTQSRNNSRAPMIAIGFDYNGVLQQGEQGRYGESGIGN